jgi:phosphomannomutase
MIRPWTEITDIDALTSYDVYAFDLDDTLGPSQREVPASVRAELATLCTRRHVCVVSGATPAQFRDCLLDLAPLDHHDTRLYALASYGAQRGTHRDGSWVFETRRSLTTQQRRDAIRTIRIEAVRMGLWVDDDDVVGLRMDDRGTQITFSALGRDAARARKASWDPDGRRRHALVEAVSGQLADCVVRLGGGTSIDVLPIGADKGIALNELLAELGTGPARCVFVGDRLYPGGNDHSVAVSGIDCISVRTWHDTLDLLRNLRVGIGSRVSREMLPRQRQL